MLSFAQLSQLLRLQALGGTAHWPILAMLLATSSAAASPVVGSLLALFLLISLVFNNFGYLMNDLVDLELDRCDPARQNHPLVSGSMDRNSASVLMWLQLPILVGLHYYGGFSAVSGIWLTLSVLILGIYNGFSKRCPLPLLMDALLGASAFCLALFGATALQSQVSTATLTFATGACLCLMMINAFHNNLRDLDYEQGSGRRTTAIYMGASLHSSGAPLMGPQMARYGWLLQIVLIGLAFILCSLLQLTGSWLLAVGFANLLNALIFGALVNARGDRWQRLSSLHLMSLPVPLMTAALAVAPAGLQLAVVLVYCLPPLVLLANKQAWRTGRATNNLQTTAFAARRKE